MKVGQPEQFPSRRFAIACVLIIGGAVFLDGLSTAIMQGLEPQESAEERCVGVAPENGVQSAQWSTCVQQEADEDGVEAALPSFVIAIACLLIAASLRFRSVEPLTSAAVSTEPSG